ncbi:Putative E3 ubiquitin-protein ligase LIN-1 [Linum grandiflorum]
MESPTTTTTTAAATSSADTEISPENILHHTTTFLSKTISEPELRSHLFAVLHGGGKTHFAARFTSSAALLLKPHSLALEAVEKAIAATNLSVQSSSLAVAEKLLLSCPNTPFSAFLLSLIYSLVLQPSKAAASLLSLFSLNPSAARSKIAPVLFQELFFVHLLPVFGWFEEQRNGILSDSGGGKDGDDDSVASEGREGYSVVVPRTKVLSKMNGGQAKELKELEGMYEEVLNENCRVFANYFIEVLRCSGGGEVCGPPPAVVLRELRRGGLELQGKNGSGEAGEFGAQFGRYNQIWNERRQGCLSDICSPFGTSTTKSTRSTSTPQTQLQSAISDSEDITFSSSSSSSSPTLETNKTAALFNSLPRSSSSGKKQFPLMADFDTTLPSKTSPPPPKDFVCPITTNVFVDPVTLETGQTYERKAIQEWLDRGNSTCPITRQKLTTGTHLPKTNYVLKRLIASWLENNPASNQPETPPLNSNITTSSSPNSVIAAAAVDCSIGQLRHAINNLCMSEILDESEAAVLRIERFWQDGKNLLGFDVQSMLARPAVVSGFVEILFNSVDPTVLRATVFLLSELGSRDKSVIQTLTRVDSDVDCIVALFKKGLLEAVVLIYLLRPSPGSLIEMDMVDSLVAVLKRKESDLVKMCVKPRTAAVLLLGQMMENSSGEGDVAKNVVKGDIVEIVVGRLESEWNEERMSAVGVLLKCMQVDGRCRNTVAEKAELANVLESFVGGDDAERFQIVRFLSELVKLNRRTFNEQVLHIIKDEGTFSTMHTFLNHLQTAPVDQSPVLAGLLLQLDLLAEPRKMSMYREEAMDTLISCLRNSEFPAAQIAAAKTIVSLPGRFSASGKSLTRAFLLKRAGLEKSFRNLVQMDESGKLFSESEELEERAAEEWGLKMASAIVSHEFGLIFEALAEGMKSRYSELHSACFVSAVWLVHMLGVLPDTGIRGAARVCLLKRFVSIFKSAKDMDDRVLALLALKSFINDPEGLQELNNYMKDLKKGLRELRKSCPLAFEILKVFSEGRDSSVVRPVESQRACSGRLLREWRGAVNCILQGQDHFRPLRWNYEGINKPENLTRIVVILGMFLQPVLFLLLKVWTGRGSILHLIQEIREHSKAVSSLVVLHSGDKLYSGSLDKTTRVGFFTVDSLDFPILRCLLTVDTLQVWSIVGDTLNCVQVYDMKEQVHNLVVASSISCFIPAGAGIKVHSWSGRSKLINSGRYVKCLSLVQGKLYCGCHDNSIQEIDLATETVSSIQTGSRKLLGKVSPVYALEVRDGLVYSAVSPLDGSPVKIWNASNHELVGSLSTTMDVRTMAISTELIYLGGKAGTIEIWDRKKHSRVETIQACTNSRVVSMAVDRNEEIFVAGTSDGWIQAWGLN